MRKVLVVASPSQQNRRNRAPPGRPSASSKPPRVSSGSSSALSGLAPLGTGRSSFSRRSSIIYGKGSQPRSDPRPINDKSFQTACMRKLVEYLVTHGYSYPISPKLLPSGKDIQNMIEFLFSRVVPSFRLSKLEDDVPNFLRPMGYPCQISKSALYAAGSPHSWPNLLAALVWLVELLTFEETEAELRGEEIVDVSDLNLKEYIGQSYNAFILGDDSTCDDLDEQCRQQMAEQFQEAKMQTEQLERQIAEVEAELQPSKSEQAPAVALETRKSMLLTDVGKFKLMVQKQSSHDASIDKKVKQQKQQLEMKNSELAKITEETKALAERIAAQSVNIEEFDRTTRELQRVHDELPMASALNKEGEKEVWDKEVLASKKIKELERMVAECNNAARRLKLSSSEAGTAAGEPFDIKQSIRPQLAALIESNEKISRERRKESPDILKLIHGREDTLQEKLRVNAQLESKSQKLEAAYELEKTVGNASLSSMAAESAALYETLRIQEDEEEQLKVFELETPQQLERAKEDVEQSASICEHEIPIWTSKLVAQIEAITGLQEHIQMETESFNQELTEFEAMVNNNYLRKQKKLSASNEFKRLRND